MYSATRTVLKEMSVLWQRWPSSNLEVGQSDSPLLNIASSAIVMLRLDEFMKLISVAS